MQVRSKHKHTQRKKLKYQFKPHCRPSGQEEEKRVWLFLKLKWVVLESERLPTGMNPKVVEVRCIVTGGCLDVHQIEILYSFIKLITLGLNYLLLGPNKGFFPSIVSDKTANIVKYTLRVCPSQSQLLPTVFPLNTPHCVGVNNIRASSFALRLACCNYIFWKGQDGVTHTVILRSIKTLQSLLSLVYI